MTTKRLILLLICIVLAAACTPEDQARVNQDLGNIPGVGANETATVTRVIDGDTIDVRLSDGTTARVRYIGINTPESNEPCYAEATAANAALVEGKTVDMFADTSNTDQYGRLLRYVYVGNTFVNAELVQGGWAEAVRYEPDVKDYEAFHQLEVQAAAQNVGCYPTGIFNDGSSTR